MPIDCLTESTFSLTEAARRLPRLRKGRPVHVSTLWRWATRGLRGVRLETTMVGGARVTSLAALEAFFNATNNASGMPSHPRSDMSAADRELTSLGL
jgi:hypothetical protein